MEAKTPYGRKTNFFQDFMFLILESIPKTYSVVY